MNDITLSVPDIHCGHCKMSIEGAVGAVSGVDKAAVTIDSATVDISFDGRDETMTAIVGAIEEQGYAVAN